MRRIIALACTALLAVCSMAQTLTSGLEVYIPIFEERFDWALNYGGNDGGCWLEDFAGALPKIENTSFSNCRRGYSCLEVGIGSSQGKYTITPSQVKSVYFTMRVMPFDNEKFPVYASSKNKKTITGESFLRGKTATDATSVYLYSGKSSDDGNNLYLDDVFVYAAEKSIDKLKSASRLLVAGTLNDAKIAELKGIVSENASLTSLDLTSASGTQGMAKLDFKNPNCIIYDPQQLLTNEENIVRTTTSSTDKFDIINSFKCEKLVISDDYPFDAMYSFNAVSVSYNRMFKNNVNGYLSTICLPFSTEKPSGVSRLYSFKNYSDGIIYFKDETKIKACTPYVVEVTDAQPFLNITDVEVKGSTPNNELDVNKNTTLEELRESKKYQFHGTFTGIEGAKSAPDSVIYGFQGGKFVYVGTEDADAVNFKPFRAYFTLEKKSTQAAARELALGGVVNAIGKVSVSPKADDKKLYTIDGIPVNVNADGTLSKSLPNGIYIKGNKKVMIKH